MTFFRIYGMRLCCRLGIYDQRPKNRHQRAETRDQRPWHMHGRRASARRVSRLFKNTSNKAKCVDSFPPSHSVFLPSFSFFLLSSSSFRLSSFCFFLPSFFFLIPASFVLLPSFSFLRSSPAFLVRKSWAGIRNPHTPSSGELISSFGTVL